MDDSNYSAPPMGMSNRLTVVLQQELNFEFPFFIAVSAMECSLAKSSAPPSVRKQPLTFCFILISATL